MDFEMYLELVMLMSWVGDTLACLPAADWCARCDDVMLNCIDVNASCLAVDHAFRFAALSNLTKDIQFQNGATLGVLGVGTQTQFDHFCTVKYIGYVHYEEQLCLRTNNVISKGVSEPSTPHEEPPVNTEDVNEFIGYIVWGGVACGMLVVFLVAVLALMLRRKRQFHGDTDDSTR
ncbi:uncharacterized protein LOC110460796 [Mizuhopecten yessoensis]|uniref:Uncharacterized protein n=1 Tax=Mizuhopecten yessoensis TaxID=6573 RepID=A0A210Q1M4_MIZYE|nr:uncharacterized protein LOC110460796 [Mizuhopecten yessoensis]OWF42640.1 hypothetical protein KP79_PYT04866 [Mizuhopecten yessoensis]